MRIFQKITRRNCSLMTWEYTANFEEVPSASLLQERFSGELPVTARRLGDIHESAVLWPMISFNSAEGRCFRYLVIIPQDHNAYKRKIRLVPSQIGLLSEADRVMKSLSFQGGSANENDGNFFFWNVRQDMLTILVFFEGRLCHWSEEPGYSEISGEILQSRLERFRKFLSEDSLFSRGKSFVEREVSFPEDELSFMKAARDPFFRRLNLAEVGSTEFRGREQIAKVLFPVLLAILAIAIFVPSENFFYREGNEIRDVAPVNLLDPPGQEKVPESIWVEIPEPGIVLKGSSAEDILESSSSSECHLPTFKIRGIIGGRFAMVNDCVGNSCPGETLSDDDSVGSYVVRGVGRDRIYLSCGKESLEIAVQ